MERRGNWRICGHQRRGVEENIFAALNTVNPLDPDYRPWCWLLGVPDGLNHYYDLCQMAESGANPDYKVFHWESAEILPADVIEAIETVNVRKNNSIRNSRASFETASDRIYEDYSKANLTNATIEPHEQLLWYHDFNFTPLSSGIRVVRDKDHVYLFRRNSFDIGYIAPICTGVCRKNTKITKNRHVLIYGDPAGRAGENTVTNPITPR